MSVFVLLYLLSWPWGSAACADGCIDLEALRRGTFGQHVTTAAEYDEACKVPVQREEALPKEGGDSIQGL